MRERRGEGGGRGSIRGALRERRCKVAAKSAKWKRDREAHAARAQSRKRFAVSNGGREGTRALPPSRESRVRFSTTVSPAVEGTLLIFRLSPGIIEWNIIFETSMTLETTTVSRFPEHHRFD